VTFAWPHINPRPPLRPWADLIYRFTSLLRGKFVFFPSTFAASLFTPLTLGRCWSGGSASAPLYSMPFSLFAPLFETSAHQHLQTVLFAEFVLRTTGLSPTDDSFGPFRPLPFGLFSLSVGPGRRVSVQPLSWLNLLLSSQCWQWLPEKGGRDNPHPLRSHR